MPVCPVPSIEMNVSILGPPSRKRCFIPRRSPRPSSPTVPIKRRSAVVCKSASFRTRSSASTAVKPRVSSPIPGAKSVSPLCRTVTSVPSGKTVSRCPATATTSPEPVPRLSASTLPSASVHAESTPRSSSISRNRSARWSSLNGGAAISVSSSKSAMVLASRSSTSSSARNTEGSVTSAATCAS